MRKGVLLAMAVTGSMAMQPDGRQVVRVGPDLGLPFSPAVRAGDFIYVSGMIAVDAQGRPTGGDVRAQTRRVLETIREVLSAAGSSLADVVSVHVYLKHAGDFQAMNDVYAGYFREHPPARTTVVADLVLGALVEVSAIAVPAGAAREVVHPSDWQRSPSPYSYGIRSGDTLFLAGLVSRRGADNQPVGGGMTKQVETVLDNAGAILQAAGMTHADLVSARVYITDAAQFDEMNAAYRRYFPADPPARATVVAGLAGADYMVEMTLVAVKDADRAVVLPEGTRPNPNLSPAIRAGRRLFLSGMLGHTAETRGDAGAQTRETLHRIERTLHAAGFDWRHVVDGVVYLTDLTDYAAMNVAYQERFADGFPARATVRTGLVAPDGLVEIMFTAVK